MQEKNNIGSFDAILDDKYGKIGSPEREEFHKEAYAYCIGQIVCNARKQEKMTQSELAEKVGKYEWKTENENTMELSKWFPVEYTMSGDNIESLSNGVGILVKGIKY